MKSTIKLKIEGLNFETLLKYIKEKNIKVYYLEKIEYNKIIIVIEYSKFLLLKNFYNIKNYKLKVLNIYGLFGVISFLKKRLGVIIGFILFICFLWYNSFYVHKIEISGLQHISNQQVLTVLKENNISNNALKKNINSSEINKLLLIRFPSFSKVSTIIKGNTLLINIKEELYVEEKISDNFVPILSDCDGIVKEVSLIQGTLNCKKGDIIKKGEVLVHPFVISSDGSKKQVIPKAKIIIDTWDTVTTTINQTETKQVKTGDFYVNQYYKFYSNKIPIHKKNIKFEKFIIEEKVYYLTKTILPIYLVEEIVYEVREENVETGSIDKDKILKELKTEIYKNISENQIVNDEFYDITIKEGKTIFTYTIQYEKVICSEN